MAQLADFNNFIYTLGTLSEERRKFLLDMYDEINSFIESIEKRARMDRWFRFGVIANDKNRPYSSTIRKIFKVSNKENLSKIRKDCLNIFIINNFL